MNKARPYVLVNMAMTADGKIATANRQIVHFGSPRDQRHLYELRATADAVMCGARTAEAPGVTLGPGPARFQRQRLRRGLPACHLRVIVSGSGTVNPAAAVFASRVSPLLIITTARAGAGKLARLRQLAEAVHVCGEQRVDFAAALTWLKREWGVRRLVVEGGAELNAALWEAGLVDELHLTVCPLIFGGREAPTIVDGPQQPALAQARRLKLISARRVGDEMFWVYRASRA
ncbi:MAG: dihydrofolate reductase family protein [Verrucomicrobiae bacterium]|nr:dihydrofolate reductase family protein [Verrucomicrobiae bacterium]